MVESMKDENIKTVMAEVVSKSGNKSITVAIEYKIKHPQYGKYVRRRTKMSVHDEHNQANVGDIVEVAHCRPYSKRKSWRLVKIRQKALTELD